MPAPLLLRIKERYMAKRTDGRSHRCWPRNPGNGKQGTVQVLGLDDLPELLELIKNRVVDSTAASKPRAQGYKSVLTLCQQGLSAPPIKRIDTGIAVLVGRPLESDPVRTR